MKGYRFCPQFIPGIICLLLFVVLLSLGRWQWQRAVYKEELLERHGESLQASPLTLQQSIALGIDVQGFPVQVQGRFNSHKTFLLDNQPQGVQPGFHVLTLLQTSSNSWVLVNRGWMSWSPERVVPTVLPPVSEELLISGQVYFPNKKQVVLKQDDFSEVQWPLLVQKLDLPAFSKMLGVELAPLVIRLSEDQMVEQQAQLPRKWPQMNMGPEKHRAYSYQWFGMAAALLILFVVFSTEKKLNDE